MLDGGSVGLDERFEDRDGECGRIPLEPYSGDADASRVRKKQLQQGDLGRGIDDSVVVDRELLLLGVAHDRRQMHARTFDDHRTGAIGIWNLQEAPPAIALPSDRSRTILAAAELAASLFQLSASAS